MGKSTKHCLILELSFLLALVVMFQVDLVFSIDTGLTFYAISNPSCEPCVKSLQPLLDLYDTKVEIYDIGEINNTKKFNEVVELTNIQSSNIPLVVVFNMEKLIVIVFGGHSTQEWERMISEKNSGIPVYYNRYDSNGIVPSMILTDTKTILNISNLFIDGETDDLVSESFFKLLPLIAMAAFVDAFNPCEFYVLAVFLTMNFHNIGRKNIITSGMAFAAAIFLSYFMMGFGFLRLITYSNNIKTILVGILGVVGLSLGILEIIGSTRNKKFKLIPDILSRRLSFDLKKLSQNPFTAFTIGIVTSIVLLPCTSGPYFIAVSLIADLERVFDGLTLLFFYNGIVTLPFIIITLGIYILRLRTSKLKRWSNKNHRKIEMFSGIAMVLLGLYLLFTITIRL